MFSRIDEMFGDIAGKLAASPIHEGVDDARFVNYANGNPVMIESVMTWANSAQLSTAEELEALIQDGKSLDGYNIDNTEQKEDTQPENLYRLLMDSNPLTRLSSR